jgi:hypothetical protein
MRHFFYPANITNRVSGRTLSNETLKWTSARAAEVIMVEQLANASRIQHRCAGEQSLAT